MIDTDKFILIALAGVVGNGLGAWNIRAISSGRYLLITILTLLAATINITALREIIREVSGVYVLAWAVGSAIGITATTWLDRRFFHRDFGERKPVLFSVEFMRRRRAWSRWLRKGSTEEQPTLEKGKKCKIF